MSGGYGFLGILVVLLAGFRAIWVAPISAFFAIVAVGSITLTLRLGIDSAIGGVLTGVLVLFALIAAGLRDYRQRQRAAALPPEPDPDAETASTGATG